MRRCFVIIPYDEGPHEKRYDDVFVPAIKQAGLEAYRVDRDPNVVIPVDRIEAEIRASQACLADISEDNPNVWYELGFAIAAGKDVVLVATRATRPRFPFDIQQRKVIRYATEAPRDFDVLRTEITKHLTARLSQQKELHDLGSTPVKELAGLEQHEVVALAVVMQNTPPPESTVAFHSIRGEMVRVGWTEIAATMALDSLLEQGMLDSVEEQGEFGESISCYSITKAGKAWLRTNIGKLRLRQPEKTEAPDDDLVPF